MKIYLASPFFNDKELDYYEKVLNILEKTNINSRSLLMNLHIVFLNTSILLFHCYFGF